jgi:predicted metal-dependent hydrolase
MRSQWGSCSSSGDITLNTALLQLPQRILDYVIVHELAHRRYSGHGIRFWNLVESAYPRAREVRKELRKYRLARLPK